MVDRLSPALVRGARGMLDWSLVDLARAAAVSVWAVGRIEHGEGNRIPYEAHTKIRRAFECEGIVFLTDGDEGMRLSKDPSVQRAPSQVEANIALPV